MKAAPGLLALLVGAAPISGPWWSSTLPVSDYPLVIVLGVVFAAIGIFAATPDSWPRPRTLSPFHSAADGTLTIAGVQGFVSAPIPWWASLVAGFFAIVCLGMATLGPWGLIRELLGRRPG